MNHISQIQSQSLMDKQLQIQIQKLEYKIDTVNSNTLNCFNEVKKLLKNSKNDTERANALNKINSLTFTAHNFFKMLEIELNQKNIKELNEHYFKKMKTISADFSKNEDKFNSLNNYFDYYNSTLNRQFNIGQIELKECPGERNEYSDRVLMTELISNIAKSEYINEMAFKAIENNPEKKVSYRGIEEEHYGNQDYSNPSLNPMNTNNNYNPNYPNYTGNNNANNFGTSQTNPPGNNYGKGNIQQLIPPQNPNYSGNNNSNQLGTSQTNYPGNNYGKGNHWNQK